jgi:predicted nucleic acid-binding protein
MSQYFVDASVLIAREDSDHESHHDSLALLSDAESIFTLDLALYESCNVAVSRWNDDVAAHKLKERVLAIANDGGLIVASASLIEHAIHFAQKHQISFFDAAYVAGAHVAQSPLVSCDVEDLLSKGLAMHPREFTSGRAE